MTIDPAKCAAPVECPKCFGTGELAHFRAVRAGVCFLCCGAGSCSSRQASQWLAAQIRENVGRAVPSAPERTAPSRPTKMVDLGHGFGRVMIQRCEDRGFTVTIDGKHGNMRAGFVVRNGLVKLDLVPNGLTARADLLRAALQAALRR